MHTHSLTKRNARSILITFVDIKQILGEVEHDMMNYRSWKKSLKLLTYTSLECNV